MQIKQKSFLLLLLFAAFIQSTGFANPPSVPSGKVEGKPAFIVPHIATDDPIWWIESELDSYYEDDYNYVDYYRYKIVFDVSSPGGYYINYKVCYWDTDNYNGCSNYYTYGGYPDVDLGVHERYRESYGWFRDTWLEVTSVHQ